MLRKGDTAVTTMFPSGNISPRPMVIRRVRDLYWPQLRRPFHQTQKERSSISTSNHSKTGDGALTAGTACSRRHFLRLGAAAALLPVGGSASTPLKIGLTPVILDDQLGFLRRWQAWLESRLETSVQFVQRLKYRDITEALLNEQIDAAWICGYPYVHYHPYLSLLAVPRYHGQPTYHSCIIVRRDLDNVSTIEQLQHRVFAFSDPDSNSGYLYPSYRFMELAIETPGFFTRTFFTWAHRNTIDAVADGLADAGAVDSYVLDQYGLHHPEVVGQTRTIERSPPFGFPPLVARKTLPEPRRDALAKVLLEMEDDRIGRSLLAELGLDGFDRGEDALFAGIRKMWQALKEPLP